MKKYLFCTLLLLILALYAGFIYAAQTNVSFETAALEAEMEEAGPQFAAALAQYPEAASRVYAIYGHTPELQEVFRRYGHNQIVPIIDKCFAEGDWLLQLGTQFDGLIDSVLNRKFEISDVRPPECGWRAILLTLAAGNSFLSQYVIDDAGKAHLLPGSSALAIIKRLTTSGLQGLEKKLVLRERPRLEEWGLAALDVAFVGIAGKTVATAAKRSIVRTARPALRHPPTTVWAGRMLLARAHAPTILKYATIAGIAYLALNHPDVITGAAGVFADAAGVSPLLVKTLVWGIILFIPLWILITVLAFLRPLFRILAISVRFALRAFHGRAQVPVQGWPMSYRRGLSLGSEMPCSAW